MAIIKYKNNSNTMSTALYIELLIEIIEKKKKKGRKKTGVGKKYSSLACHYKI